MNFSPQPDRLTLPQVTLCAVTSLNLSATQYALERCLKQIAFADCKLLTDACVAASHPEIRVVPIERLHSAAAYSDFMLRKLVDYIQTPYALVVQWDGHVLAASRWRPEFLDYDYIGASWPQFTDGCDVGNGGFSLRSARLLRLCSKADFMAHHPEDVAIGRINRPWLQTQGIRFAPRELAALFSAERCGNLQTAFGYHGIWHMPHIVGVEPFWNIYRELDWTRIHKRDFRTLMRAVCQGPEKRQRAWRMLVDRFITRCR
ncbi:MAG: hypothetical protein LBF16_14765 [Pseudomonadales bacterium]|jgi:hypothetical protein|nr:hypothetical protein [Pseudomonadales bacterium]